MVFNTNADISTIFPSDSTPNNILKIKLSKSAVVLSPDFLKQNKECIDTVLKKINANKECFTQGFLYNGIKYELRAYKDIHSGEYKGRIFKIGNLNEFYNTCLKISCHE